MPRRSSSLGAVSGAVNPAAAEPQTPRGRRAVLAALRARRWVIVEGPREINAQIGRFDMDFPAWAYDLERDGKTHTVTVVVAAGRMESLQLVEASRRAIASRGRAAVNGILASDDPRRFMLVTSAGVQEIVDDEL